MLNKEEKKNTEFLHVRNSRKMYFPIYLMVFILIFIIGYIKYNGLALNNIALILGIIFIIFAIKSTEIHRFLNLYEINNNFVVHTSGIFSKKVKNIELTSISDVRIDQNLWQRIMGYGNIYVSLFAEVNIVRNVNNPRKFVNFLEKKMDSKRRAVSI